MTGLQMDAFGAPQAVTGDVFTALLRAGVDRDEKGGERNPMQSVIRNFVTLLEHGLIVGDRRNLPGL